MVVDSHVQVQHGLLRRYGELGMSITALADTETRKAGLRSSPTNKVVPAYRNGRWGWAVEWTIPGEFPVTRGFFHAEEAARAAADRGVFPDC